MRDQVEALIGAAFDGKFRLEAGTNYAVPCPFHGDRPGKRHLYVNRDNGLWVCFRCEEKGHFTNLVWRLFKEVDRSLEPRLFLGKSTVKRRKKLAPARAVEEKVPTGTHPVWEETSHSLVENPRKAALQYLSDRGVSEDSAKFHGIRVAITGKYNGRVLVPVISPVTHEPVGWVCRAFKDSVEPKYLNTLAGDTSVNDYLFGLDKVIGIGRQVVLVEGVFDAMPHGVRFLAMLGKSLSRRQLSSLVKSRMDRVTVMLDPDASRDAKKVAKSLVMHVPEVRVAQLEGAKDPGDATKSQVSRALESATIF